MDLFFIQIIYLLMTVKKQGGVKCFTLQIYFTTFVEDGECPKFNAKRFTSAH